MPQLESANSEEAVECRNESPPTLENPIFYPTAETLEAKSELDTAVTPELCTHNEVRDTEVKSVGDIALELCMQNEVKYTEVKSVGDIAPELCMQNEVRDTEVKSVGDIAPELCTQNEVRDTDTEVKSVSDIAMECSSYDEHDSAEATSANETENLDQICEETIQAIIDIVVSIDNDPEEEDTDSQISEPDAALEPTVVNNNELPATCENILPTTCSSLGEINTGNTEGNNASLVSSISDSNQCFGPGKASSTNIETDKLATSSGISNSNVPSDNEQVSSDAVDTTSQRIVDENIRKAYELLSLLNNITDSPSSEATSEIVLDLISQKMRAKHQTPHASHSVTNESVQTDSKPTTSKTTEGDIAQIESGQSQISGVTDFAEQEDPLCSKDGRTGSSENREAFREVTAIHASEKPIEMESEESRTVVDHKCKEVNEDAKDFEVIASILSDNIHRNKMIAQSEGKTVDKNDLSQESQDQPSQNAANSNDSNKIQTGTVTSTDSKTIVSTSSKPQSIPVNQGITSKISTAKESDLVKRSSETIVIDVDLPSSAQRQPIQQGIDKRSQLINKGEVTPVKSQQLASGARTPKTPLQSATQQRRPSGGSNATSAKTSVQKGDKGSTPGKQSFIDNLIATGIPIVIPDDDNEGNAHGPQEQSPMFKLKSSQYRRPDIKSHGLDRPTSGQQDPYYGYAPGMSSQHHQFTPSKKNPPEQGHAPFSPTGLHQFTPTKKNLPEQGHAAFNPTGMMSPRSHMVPPKQQSSSPMQATSQLAGSRSSPLRASSPHTGRSNVNFQRQTGDFTNLHSKQSFGQPSIKSKSLAESTIVIDDDAPAVTYGNTRTGQDVRLASSSASSHPSFQLKSPPPRTLGPRQVSAQQQYMPKQQLFSPRRSAQQAESPVQHIRPQAVHRQVQPGNIQAQSRQSQIQQHSQQRIQVQNVQGISQQQQPSQQRLQTQNVQVISQQQQPSQQRLQTQNVKGISQQSVEEQLHRQTIKMQAMQGRVQDQQPNQQIVQAKPALDSSQGSSFLQQQQRQAPIKTLEQPAYVYVAVQQPPTTPVVEEMCLPVIAAVTSNAVQEHGESTQIKEEPITPNIAESSHFPSTPQKTPALSNVTHLQGINERTPVKRTISNTSTQSSASESGEPAAKRRNTTESPLRSPESASVKSPTGTSMLPQRYNLSSLSPSKMPPEIVLDIDTDEADRQQPFDPTTKEYFKNTLSKTPNKSVAAAHSTTKGSGKKKGRPPSAKKEVFQCEECEEICATKTILTQHLKTHAAGDKPFKCDVCGKKYSQKTSLKKHIYTHFKDKK